MSKEAAEHHTKAAEHHELAAQHHREAASHHEAGEHERKRPATRNGDVQIRRRTGISKLGDRPAQDRRRIR
jgi:hypothetical protein